MIYPKDDSNITNETLLKWHSNVHLALSLLNEVPAINQEGSQYYPHGENLTEARANLNLVVSQLNTELLDRGIPF